ncbi:MAG: hypothetical protein Ta2B_17940 [Termitinemataceae bacterium]|nr:MAG: hypothetical protein Ta2B_17940 [Termitinemataceae bacterium]
MNKSVVTKKEHTLAYIFGKTYDEVFMSKWLEFLIKPAEYGNIDMLNVLLKLYDENISIPSDEEISVKREYGFRFEGRQYYLDLFIRTKKYALIIENKVDSLENTQEGSKGQLHDYSKWIDLEISTNVEYKNLKPIKILLKPRSNQAPAKHGFKEITYEDLANKLKVEVDFNKAKDERSKFMMQEFITHINEYIAMNYEFNGTEDDRSELIEKIICKLKTSDKNWEARSSTPNISFYKKNWGPRGIFIQLKANTSDGIPSCYDVSLQARKARNKVGDIIDEANDKYASTFNINSGEGFSDSLEELIELVNKFKDNYTVRIDDGFTDKEDVQESSMNLKISFKKYCEFFWLMGINDVDLTKHCKKCLIGITYKDYYSITKENTKEVFPFEYNRHIKHDSNNKAYYLCGLSENYVYENNTHLAFTYCPDENIIFDTEEVHVEINNAKRIEFENYNVINQNNYGSEFTTCRNWIFANYFKNEITGNNKKA